MPRLVMAVCTACAADLASNRPVVVRHSGTDQLRDSAAACKHILADIAARDPKQITLLPEAGGVEVTP